MSARSLAADAIKADRDPIDLVCQRRQRLRFQFRLIRNARAHSRRKSAKYRVGDKFCFG